MEAATAALENGSIERPDFALIFCSGKHNPHEFMEGIRSVLGDTPNVGGSAPGIITHDFLAYEGFEAGVTIFSSDNISFKSYREPDINLGERKAGAALGKQIKEGADDLDHSLLLFYDSSKQSDPPMLNFATWLCEGIDEHLPKHITCAGAGLLADMQLSTTYQFHNGEVLTQTAVAVLIGGKCSVHTTIMHGCRPSSSYLTITKTQGPVVSEIDNKPALEVIDGLLGQNHGIKWKDFPLFVTLGVNKGDKFEVFNERNYANRLTLAIDEPGKSLIMFEPDLKNGDEVQLMRRSVDLDYIESGIADLRTKVNGSKPVFSFYINCAGRCKPYSGGDFEDAEEVQRIIGPSVPLMGFYSGVEIAKVGDKMRPLDWTGVLCMLCE
jgi:hypothetical protein